MANLMTGIFIDGGGVKREITIAVDADGQLLTAGGGGGVTQSQVTTAIDASADIEAIKTQSASIDGKLPAASALSDSGSNPTTIRAGSLLQVFNGTTWDRVRSGISGAVSSVLGYINVISVNRYNNTPPTLTDGQWINPQIDANGRILVTEPIRAFDLGETQTAATGTNWTALESGATKNITVRNRTVTSIDIRKIGGSTFLSLADGDDVPLPVLTNSNEWEIKRTDNSNTQVTIKFLRFA